MININAVKLALAKKYPNHPLTKVVLRSPDLLDNEQFLGAVSVWLALIDSSEVN
ncbi:MAG: hypothetical protein QXZ12_05245 [Thermoplasmata archaeon]